MLTAYRARSICACGEYAAAVAGVDAAVSDVGRYGAHGSGTFKAELAEAAAMAAAAAVMMSDSKNLRRQSHGMQIPGYVIHIDRIHHDHRIRAVVNQKTR